LFQGAVLAEKGGYTSFIYQPLTKRCRTLPAECSFLQLFQVFKDDETFILIGQIGVLPAKEYIMGSITLILGNQLWRNGIAGIVQYAVVIVKHRMQTAAGC
jgi:hypothetical protein